MGLGLPRWEKKVAFFHGDPKVIASSRLEGNLKDQHHKRQYGQVNHQSGKKDYGRQASVPPFKL
jgi:hypothetical protein